MSDNGLEQALGRIPSGIFLVAAKQGKEESVLLASWIQQASFDPPTVTVAVHKDRPMALRLEKDAIFLIHVLTSENKELYGRFVRGMPEEDPYQGLNIERDESGAVLFLDALSVLRCRVRSRVDGGDHHLVVAEVLDGRMLAGGEPRVHVRKSGLSY